ncbi:MAG: hypothetical protein AAGC95_04100 [Pseudomonadota bacterium]
MRGAGEAIRRLAVRKPPKQRLRAGYDGSAESHRTQTVPGAGSSGLVAYKISFFVSVATVILLSVASFTITLASDSYYVSVWITPLLLLILGAAALLRSARFGFWMSFGGANFYFWPLFIPMARRIFFPAEIEDPDLASDVYGSPAVFLFLSTAEYVLAASFAVTVVLGGFIVYRFVRRKSV